MCKSQQEMLRQKATGIFWSHKTEAQGVIDRGWGIIIIRPSQLGTFFSLFSWFFASRILSKFVALVDSGSSSSSKIDIKGTTLLISATKSP